MGQEYVPCMNLELMEGGDADYDVDGKVASVAVVRCSANPEQ